MVSEVSILIPVYNFVILNLVESLLAQCHEADITFEIICLDDGSEEKFKVSNRRIADWPGVIYEELPNWVSRSAIRNILGYRAKYAYLLFLDNDSEIIASDYILKYLRHAQPQQIIIGGTVYNHQPPAPEYTLHWLVGRKREQKPALFRNRHPYQRVHVNNALVPQETFRQFTFDETLIDYGHEDTEWGKRLEQARIVVQHLENPVNHRGLETAEVYLRKTEQAVRNLQYLYFTQQVGASTPLIRWYLRLSKFRLLPFFYALYRLIKPLLWYNLRSTQPHLTCFDVYKLGIFIQAEKERTRQQQVSLIKDA